MTRHQFDQKEEHNLRKINVQQRPTTSYVLQLSLLKCPKVYRELWPRLKEFLQNFKMQGEDTSHLWQCLQSCIKHLIDSSISEEIIASSKDGGEPHSTLWPCRQRVGHLWFFSRQGGTPSGRTFDFFCSRVVPPPGSDTFDFSRQGANPPVQLRCFCFLYMSFRFKVANKFWIWKKFLVAKIFYILIASETMNSKLFCFSRVRHLWVSRPLWFSVLVCL